MFPARSLREFHPELRVVRDVPPESATRRKLWEGEALALLRAISNGSRYQAGMSGRLSFASFRALEKICVPHLKPQVFYRAPSRSFYHSRLNTAWIGPGRPAVPSRGVTETGPKRHVFFTTCSAYSRRLHPSGAGGSF